MKLYVPLVLGGLLLMTTVPAEAHHSMPNFWYMDRTVEIEGVVQSVKIVNPHPEMVVEATNPDGTTSIWRITGAGNASAMIRNGWTNKTLAAGMKVRVAGHPSQNPWALESQEERVFEERLRLPRLLQLRLQQWSGRQPPIQQP